MSYHFSVDVGGTFTDLFAVDAEAGSVIVQKTDTSEDAVGGVLTVLEQGGIPLERISTLRRTERSPVPRSIGTISDIGTGPQTRRTMR